MTVTISVVQYERMIAAAIFPEGAPIELINGLLLYKDRSKAGEDTRTVGTEHVWVVTSLAEINPQLRSLGYHIQTQSPVIVGSHSEPSPDGAVLVGTADDYLRAKPRASDVTCIIEVADSSLDFDRTTKLRAYAEAGIPQYVIVNLIDRVLEEHTLPNPASGRYETSRVLRVGQVLELYLRGEERFSIQVSDWLPPRD